MPARTKSQPALFNLPSELILQICSSATLQDLLQIRSSCSYLASPANYLLEKNYTERTSMLSMQLLTSKTRYRELERTLAPHLTHYRHFLRNLGVGEVGEVAWYSTPPPELHTVATCLYILKHGCTPLAEDERPCGSMVPWQTVKKTFSQFSFKNWFTNLRTNVDSIPFSNIKIVERIIQLDAAITYERLRDVSMAGYKLLIVVAAILQYGTISEDIKREFQVLTGVEQELARAEKFLEYLTFPVLPFNQELQVKAPSLRIKNLSLE